ncbi:Do family serine endopeptidase [Rhodosalinus sediminis]|uniref:Probable periplasmic serine endoprotease DegP-like n=1 Tax=Rhodosalinus sediminis TaxID=1940533 RepID=A0A3D9BYW6_9RHOB|nr:Do family serine endopeptidase [Rhodosalinus sediminis]REC58733.1 Do family serine endopeptidase [Rhodosalinus sediminis]
MTRPSALPQAPRAAALAAALLAAPAAGAQESAQTTAPGNGYATPPGFAAMVADKQPAVVGILSTAPARAEGPRPGPQLPPGLRDFFGGPGPMQRGPMRAQGSGFIISPDGYVVTNDHVVRRAEEVEVVRADETRLEAEVVGTDPATDLALLKVETDAALPAVAWGDSRDVAVGEWMVAIGNPFGLQASVTAGILSARSRDIRSGPYDAFLQTDAAINRGNSGGPLFNTAGEVVGVNTAIVSPSGGSVGIGFAVPSRVAQSVIADLRDDGEVERGYLGVRMQPVDAALAAALDLPEDAGGALVAQVTEDSPAAAAGLRAGDVITSIAGEAIEDPRALSFAVAALESGQEVPVTVLRDGSEETLTVTIGEQPAGLFARGEPRRQAPERGRDGESRLGVTVAPLTDELRARADLPPRVEGLVVAGVAPGSPAAAAGLRQGDVIAAANGEALREVAALREAAAAADEGDRPLLLRVFRNGAYTFLALPLDAGGDG